MAKTPQSEKYGMNLPTRGGIPPSRRRWDDTIDLQSAQLGRQIQINNMIMYLSKLGRTESLVYLCSSLCACV